MRIQGVVFGEGFGGEMVDVGAERPVVDRRGGLRDLPHGMVERVGWRVRSGLLHIQRWRGVQVIDRCVEEGIVAGGWRIWSVPSGRIEVVV